MELTASNVWTVVASALVLFMTPGLAFFYGGMTRAKSTLNMIMMSMISMGIVGVIWVLWGYSMITSEASFAQIIGSPLEYLGLSDMVANDPGSLLGVAFSAVFAIIAVALISGAIADRAKFGAWCIFVPLWITFVYCPLAFMVWNGGGLFKEDGAIGSIFGEAIDFAGGLVIHINAGVAALILALVLGARKGFGKDPNQRPHSLPFVMLGAAILWFGWFGFNVGAAADPGQAGLTFVNTIAAPAAAMLGWVLLERFRDGHATSLGAASGLVAGLVAITPACANVSPVGAIIIGFISGLLSGWAITLKFKVGYDDSLDVVGVHLVSGIWGTVAIGLSAIPGYGETTLEAGLFYGGGMHLFVGQLVSTIISIIYSAIVTFIIVIAIHKTIGFRVSEKQEVQGIDLAAHAETAYAFASGTSGNFIKNS